MDLATVITYMYPTAVPLEDFRVQDRGDGAGAFIAYWSTAKLGPQPLPTTLTSNWIAALKVRKERELQLAANQEFVDSEYVFQGIIVGCLWAKGTALNATEQAIFDSMNARYTKLKNKIAAVRNATTEAQIEAVVWP